MKPCPFFLEGKCRFEADDCSYSHGHLVAQGDILPYREPDHASLGLGVVCLARDGDSGLWKRAEVTSVEVTGVGVTFDEQRREAVLEYSSVLPLGGWGRGGAVFSMRAMDGYPVLPQRELVVTVTLTGARVARIVTEMMPTVVVVTVTAMTMRT